MTRGLSTEMIERIAHAMENSAHAPLSWGEYLHLAEVAVREMREPTAAMERASYKIDDMIGDPHAHGGAHWQAMIDEALSRSPPQVAPDLSRDALLAAADAVKAEFRNLNAQWFVDDASNDGPCDMTPWALLASAALKTAGLE